MRPLHVLAHDWAEKGDKYHFELEQSLSPRQQATWKSKGVEALQQRFATDLQNGITFYCTCTKAAGAKLLLLAIWSDEYAQFEYRKKQYRIVTLRVLNSPVIEDHFIGIFPEGMIQSLF